MDLARFTGLDAVRGTPAATPEPVRSSRARTSTAVLERDERPQPDLADDADDADGLSDQDDEPTERRTTTPEVGSAAERAAARRARMRQDRDEKGKS